MEKNETVEHVQRFWVSGDWPRIKTFTTRTRVCSNSYHSGNSQSLVLLFVNKSECEGERKFGSECHKLQKNLLLNVKMKENVNLNVPLSYTKNNMCKIQCTNLLMSIVHIKRKQSSWREESYVASLECCIMPYVIICLLLTVASVGSVVDKVAIG